MQKIVLIDYGSGNLRSAQKALVAAAATLSGGFDICASDDPKIIAAADRLVLPGVGAFAACMRALGERTGVIEAMKMECPFESPASGTVEAIYIAEGHSLQPGAPMLALRRAA